MLKYLVTLAIWLIAVNANSQACTIVRSDEDPIDLSHYKFVADLEDEVKRSDEYMDAIYIIISKRPQCYRLTIDSSGRYSASKYLADGKKEPLLGGNLSKTELFRIFKIRVANPLEYYVSQCSGTLSGESFECREIKKGGFIKFFSVDAELEKTLGSDKGNDPILALLEVLKRIACSD